jgi:hypothetical protein
MKGKSKHGFQVTSVVFAALVFTLVTVLIAYLGSVYGLPDVLLLFLYVAAFAVTFAFLHDYLSRRIDLDLKRRLALAFGLLMISVMGSQGVWIVITPKWSFSVSTDKSVYKLGEEVKITASLKNLGYITHSINAGVSDPIRISVTYEPYPTIYHEVWYSPFQTNPAEFHIGPNQSLSRNFIWNQTVSPFYSSEYENGIQPGTYAAIAFIPKDCWPWNVYESSFSASAPFTITP